MKCGKMIYFAYIVMVAVFFTIPVFAGTKDAGELFMKGIGKLHVPFIANDGQMDERVAFYANTFGGVVYVTKKGEIIYSLPKLENDMSGGNSNNKELALHKEYKGERLRYEKQKRVKGIALKEVTLEGFEPHVAGGEKAETVVNYFKGNDSEGWRTNIATYKTVSLGEIYPGVKLELKAYGNNVEKIFRVEPGIDPEVIQLKLSGAKGIWVDKEGELAIETELDPAGFTAPVAYQYKEGKKATVKVSYTIKKPDPLKKEDHELVYGFRVENYDKTKELIIDPLLSFTYLGGSDSDFAYAIGLDSNGNVYVAGTADSFDFPTTDSAYDTTYDYKDVFISKLDSSLLSIQSSTYIGGSYEEYFAAMALDNSGNVYVTGNTKSSNYPTTSGAYDTTYDYKDVFISKLDSSLSKLESSTYVDNSDYNTEEVYDLAIDGSGNVYVTGIEYDVVEETTDGNYINRHAEVFVFKLNNKLTSLLADTLFGGLENDEAMSIAIDSSDNVYVAGETWSIDFPTTGSAYDTTHNGSDDSDYDVFIAKLDSGLSSLKASTYLGGSSSDLVHTIVINGSSTVYVAGQTYSENFPVTTGAYDISYNGDIDVFISKLDSSLTSMQSSTYLGGSDGESDFYGKRMTLAMDGSGNIYVAGRTQSNDFPTTEGAYNTSLNESTFYHTDGFISKFDSTLSHLQASTYLGGTDIDQCYAIALDDSGNIYVSGETASNDFPNTGDGYYTSLNGNYFTSFIAKLDNNLTSSPPTDSTPVPTPTNGLGRISGYVYDIDGEPIESVKVTIKGVVSGEKVNKYTDTDGFFEFNDVEPGTYKISVKKKRYKKAKETVSVNSGQEKYVEIEMRKSSKSRSYNIEVEEEVVIGQ